MTTERTATWRGRPSGLGAPAGGVDVVTPSTSYLTYESRGVQLISGGNIHVNMAGSTVSTGVTLEGLGVGVIHAIRITRIQNSTNTTSTSAVNVYW